LAGGASGRSFERGDDLVRRQRAAQRQPALELADEPVECLERPQILERLITDGR
jgi:hypothetical protein